MARVIDKWDDAAEAYLSNQETSEYARVNREVVARHFAGTAIGRVLDAGCGYGYYTEFFRSLGWEAVGCDGSERMISLARRRYPLCAFECADIQRPLPYEDGSFDLVFCNQVLMDVEVLGLPICEFYRVVRAGGRFYMAIVHPAFYDGQWVKDENGFKYGKTIARYLSEYQLENDFWGRTIHFHRPIGKYLNTITDAGFTLKYLEEPVAYDGIQKTRQIPLFLFAEFQK